MRQLLAIAVLLSISPFSCAQGINGIIPPRPDMHYKTYFEAHIRASWTGYARMDIKRSDGWVGRVACERRDLDAQDLYGVVEITKIDDTGFDMKAPARHHLLIACEGWKKKDLTPEEFKKLPPTEVPQ